MSGGWSGVRRWLRHRRSLVVRRQGRRCSCLCPRRCCRPLPPCLPNHSCVRYPIPHHRWIELHFGFSLTIYSKSKRSRVRKEDLGLKSLFCLTNLLLKNL
ncbi:unnamed protein product [Taenia asiatica]|uniref:Uncharacterized protein n=1 Tax=Taenia asiatica TaxID=60517 RepID=A0A0R3VW87_TAEAS|nr:unnamed protein product [Taenia asiatica]